MSKQQTSIRKISSRLLRWRNLIWVAVIFLIWWAFKDIPWNDVWMLLSRLGVVQISILLAVNMLILLVFSSRLWIILRGKGIHVPLPRLISYWLIGFVTSYLIPGPQLSGAPVQVYLLHKNDGLELSEATASVMTSKFLELISSAVFMMFGLLAIFQSQLFSIGTNQALIVFALGMLAFAIWYLWATWRGKKPLTRLLGWLPASLQTWQPLHMFHKYIISVEEQIGEFSREKPLLMLVGLGISILSWTMVVVESWLAVTFLGAQISYIEVYIVVVIAQVAFLFPSPAGLGALEAGLVFAFPGLGYSASLGTALALLLRFQDVLVSVLGLAAGGWRFYRKDIQSELQSEMELPAAPEESSARTDSDQPWDYDNHLTGVRGQA